MKYINYNVYKLLVERLCLQTNIFQFNFKEFLKSEALFKL